MRKSVETLMEWIRTNQEDGWNISISDFVSIIKKKNIISGAKGTMKVRLYELNKKSQYITISNGILTYHKDRKVPIHNPLISPENRGKLHEFFENNVNMFSNQLEESKNKHILLDLHSIFSCDTDLFDWIIQNPDEATPLIQDEIKSKFDCECDVRYTNAYAPREEPQLSRNLTSSKVDQLSSIYASPTILDSAQLIVDVAVFDCVDCSESIQVKQGRGDGQLTPPPKCTGCANYKTFIFKPKKSKYQNIQKIELTEPLPKLQGCVGERMNAFVMGDTHRVDVGEDCEITGILRTVPPSKKSIIYDKVLDISSIETVELKLEVTPEDIDTIKTYVNDKETPITNLLVSSIAPFISGYEELKLGLALQLFRCPSYSFGGDRKRGNIHTLIIGDPGVAKSKFLKYLDYISPKSIYVSGKGASAAGLTVSTHQLPDRGWVVRAGAAVRASGGNLYLDEGNECDDDVIKGLNEAMESGTVSTTKAAGPSTYPAEVNLCMTANPKRDRFDGYKPLSEQYGIPATTLSRFDLIFVIRDEVDKERDANISTKVMDGWMQGTKDDDDNDLLSPDLIRKYVQYAQTIKPKMTKEAANAIGEYYVKLRGASKHTISVTARSLESIARLSTAMARIHLSNKVLVKHVEPVLRLYEYTLRQIATNADGEIEVDRIIADHTTYDRNILRAIEGVIRNNISRNEDKLADLETVISDMEAEGLTRVNILKKIDELKNDGIIYSPKHDKLNIVNET